MAYLIVISSEDLSQKLTEWKCNIQGLALPNTTLNQQTLKKKFERNSPPMFRCVLGISWDDLPPVKGRKQNTVEFQEKKFVQWWTIHYLSCGGEGRGEIIEEGPRV